MLKPVRLELNNSGSWKVIGRFDADDVYHATLVMSAAEDLIEILHNSEDLRRCPSLRITKDDGLSTVLSRWSIDEGWCDATTGARA